MALFGGMNHAGECQESWDSLTAQQRNHLVDGALAVLQFIRAPSRAMLLAGQNPPVQSDDNPGHGLPMLSSLGIKATFSRMVDAAITDQSDEYGFGRE
jgi:hypothetical protein